MEVANAFLRLLNTLLISLVLSADLAFGIVEHINCSGTDLQKVNNALHEAVSVAQDVSKKLNTFDASQPYADLIGDPRHAIYSSILRPQDKYVLQGYLNSIATIRTSNEFKVRIYCSPDHVIKHESPADHNEYWWDKDFYHNEDGHQVVMSLRAGNLPSPTQGTFTSLGRISGVKSDATGQAHMFIDANTIARDTNPNVDGRMLTNIRNNGLREDVDFNSLDYIRPLTRSVLHELFHIVGGLVNPKSNVASVIDVRGPKGRNLGTFRECVSQKNRNPPAVKLAECLNTVTIGLFLQIQNRNTYWTFGIVNRVTLRPDGVSYIPTSRKRLVVN
ncbi:hypothetical protein F4677DRAFT_440207 [Hypoxylon crocopeplum]|nr:hypothetical protein F4677DRAFT_440207 [Hypoxylon crocopeplum]